MDIQLQQLLETIKSEGVEAADKKAAEIIAKAEEQAKAIEAEARQKAAKIVHEAETKAKQFEDASRAAVQQAGRDLILTIEKQLGAVFSRLVDQTVRETYQGAVLEKAILDVVHSWATEAEGATVMLNPEQVKALEATLKGKIGEKLGAGVTIMPSSKVEAGFILKQKDGAAYYDFTASAIAEVLSTYLNPVLAEIIKGREA